MADRVEKGTKEYEALMKAKKAKADADEAETIRKTEALRAENAKGNEFTKKLASMSAEDRKKRAVQIAQQAADQDARQAAIKAEEIANAVKTEGTKSNDEAANIRDMIIRNQERKKFREGTSQYIKTGRKQ